MTDELIIYCILGLVAILSVLAFSLKLEKLVQIILGNYILCSLCFSLGICIDSLIGPDPESQILHFVSDAKVRILLLIYGLFFFFFVYRRSKIRIDFSSDPMIYKPLYIFMGPFAVISMLVTIGLIVLGLNAFSPNALISASTFTQNIYLQKIILNFPYIVLIYSVLSLFVIVDLKVKVNVSISTNDS